MSMKISFWFTEIVASLSADTSPRSRVSIKSFTQTPTRKHTHLRICSCFCDLYRSLCSLANAARLMLGWPFQTADFVRVMIDETHGK
eukprot:1046282-Pleurochrysis_carterae.AAC.1